MQVTELCDLIFDLHSFRQSVSYKAVTLCLKPTPSEHLHLEAKSLFTEWIEGRGHLQSARICGPLGFKVGTIGGI